MRDVATALVSVGILSVLALTGIGLDPKRTPDLLPRIAFGLAGGAVVLGLLLHLLAMVVVDGWTVEAGGISAAQPIREFGYRWRKFHAGIVFAFAGLLAVPLVVVLPILWLRGVPAAGHPAVIGMSAFTCLLGGFLGFVARRGWAARVTIYPDRLAVRGIYSNGSLRWEEATAFTHEEVIADRWNTMWVYVLSGTGRFVRVEFTVERPEEFVREVEARTGLALEKVPRS